MIAYASEHIETAERVLGRIENAVLFPLMTLMIAVALLVFMWGIFEYVANADDDGAREKGRKHMLYGVIGFLVMVSALGILRIAGNTVGCDIDTPGGCNNSFQSR